MTACRWYFLALFLTLINGFCVALLKGGRVTQLEILAKTTTEEETSTCSNMLYWNRYMFNWKQYSFTVFTLVLRLSFNYKKSNFS